MGRLYDNFQLVCPDWPARALVGGWRAGELASEPASHAIYFRVFSSIGSTTGLASVAVTHTCFHTQTAIIYEADEPGEGYEVSYAQLLREVCGIANVLKSLGVKKGDTVSVYLPMTWHAVAAFLACARIGAVHSVVFAGFSAESLRDRVQDCKSRVLITSDEGRRGGKAIATKVIADAAVKECPDVEHVLVLKRTGNDVPFTPGRDKWWHEEIAKVPSYCPPEVMSSEDPLFILYVSPCQRISAVIK